VQDFEGMKAAKEKEIAAATQAIEEKTKRTGEVAVEIVNLKEDLEDTQEDLAKDSKFLADLEKNCEVKKKGMGRNQEDAQRRADCDRRHYQNSQR
jgi:hypothetical protein